MVHDDSQWLMLIPGVSVPEMSLPEGLSRRVSPAGSLLERSLPEVSPRGSLPEDLSRMGCFLEGLSRSVSPGGSFPEGISRRLSPGGISSGAPLPGDLSRRAFPGRTCRKPAMSSAGRPSGVPHDEEDLARETVPKSPTMEKTMPDISMVKKRMPER